MVFVLFLNANIKFRHCLLTNEEEGKSWQSTFLFLKILFILKERERETEKKRKINIWEKCYSFASLVPPLGTWLATQTCPDWESNWGNQTPLMFGLRGQCPIYWATPVRAANPSKVLNEGCPDSVHSCPLNCGTLAWLWITLAAEGSGKPMSPEYHHLSLTSVYYQSLGNSALLFSVTLAYYLTKLCKS